MLLDDALQVEMVRRTAEAMKPLADAGKLSAYLLELTPAFDPRQTQLDELAPVIEVSPPFRSRSSSGAAAGPRPSASRESCWLSAPTPSSSAWTPRPGTMSRSSRRSTPSPTTPWPTWRHREHRGLPPRPSVAERFDYDYSADELRRSPALAALDSDAERYT